MWPYVNGKALMSGLNLREMEASNMLDVLHFLFEEDWVPASPEMVEARSEVRVALYRDMYGTEYKYKVAPKRNNVNPANGRQYTNRAMDDTYVSDLDGLADEKPFDPRATPPKPFTPASDFNPDSALPFEGLDAPLG